MPVIGGMTHITKARPAVGNDPRYVSGRQNLVIAARMVASVNALGSLRMFRPLQSQVVRVAAEIQGAHMPDFQKQGMIKKCLCLFLGQRSAMQEAVKREEIRQRRCAI